MSKKRFIIILTFLAGVYYFLEFVVPGIVPGMGGGDKVMVRRIDRGHVTYRLPDGAIETFTEEPLAKKDARTMKRRNAFDEMTACDLSQLRKDDVITVGEDDDTAYGEQADIKIRPPNGETVVSINKDKLVTIGDSRVKIDGNRPLKIDAGKARIWKGVGWRSAPVKPGYVLSGEWYEEMDVDFTDIVTITANQILLRSPKTPKGKPHTSTEYSPRDTIVLGKPVGSILNPDQLGIVKIQNGRAAVTGGNEYDLKKNHITVVPPKREGEPTLIRVGRTTRILPPEEGLYKYRSTPYEHVIQADEHIEITKDKIAISKRGVVTKVVHTVLQVKPRKRPLEERAVTASTLIIRYTSALMMVGRASVEQPRESEVRANELSIGDRIEVGQTTYLSRWLVPVGDYMMVVGAFGVGLGMFNLLLMHGSIIRKRKENWSYSIILMIAILAMLVCAFFRNWSHETLGYKVYDFIFTGMLDPMGSTTFSLLAFYLASAAYRAFKIKTAEAAVMSISAVIVMMGQVPIGIWLTKGLPHYLRLEVMSAWILSVAHTGAFTAVMFGSTVGAVAMALRLWFNLERNVFFDQEL